MYSRNLIIGANGYIGKKIFSFLGPSDTVLGSSSRGGQGLMRLNLESFDLSEWDHVGDGDMVFFTAAISDPQICANERERAWRINVESTSILIERFLKRHAHVIFLSSDTVYGEQKSLFGEEADCHPVGEYAVMKREVEKRFYGDPNFKVVRLSYVFSAEDRFSRYLLECDLISKSAEIFHPFTRAIIHRDDVVLGVASLARRWADFPQPVINFGGAEPLSRVDFAQIVKEVALKKLTYTIIEPSADFFASRPRVIAMQSSILPELLGRCQRSLREAAALEFRGV